MTSELKFLHLSDFTGGLNTFNPPTELPINQSPDLDNIVLSEKGFFKRLGDVAFNDTPMAAVPVTGLTHFRQSAGEYLVSICGDKIYKSDSLDGTMDDITGSVTITAGQNNIWQFVTYNDLCIGVGGAPDAPIKWSGTGNAAALGGSPQSGTACWQANNRVHIINGSTDYWCALSNPEDWSGAGSGNATVDTNDGDNLVGGIPVNNNVALLFKNYSVHQMNISAAPFPVTALNKTWGLAGKNAAVNVGGIVYFITKEPRMRATDGYTFTEFPNSINNIWDGINKNRLAYIQGVYDPVVNQLKWFVSDGTSTTNNLCIAWDFYRQCWLRYTTGFACNVVTIVGGYRLFGGHYNGTIYEKGVSGIHSDASTGAPVTGYWRTPWVIDDSAMIVKQPRYMDIGFVGQPSGYVKYTYGFNYTPDMRVGQVSQMLTSGVWGTSLWGSTFVWGGATLYQKRQTMFGRGNNFQVKLYNDEDAPMEINFVDIALRKAGVKEVPNI